MNKVHDFFGLGKGSKNCLLQSVLVGRRELSWGRVGIPTSFFYRRGMHIAQGDSPSPLLYNFAGQILLFKIELNPRIVPACPRKIGLVPYEPFDPFEHESNKGDLDLRVFCCFTFTLLCYHSLSELKNNMDAFRILSGLSCNIDKTLIMRIGDLSGEISENILSLGFKFVDKVKILRFDVINSHQWDLNNFNTVTEKIRKLIQFWSRF